MEHWSAFAEWWDVDRLDTALAALLLVVAGLTAWAALKEVKQQAKDSHSRSRPVVTAYLVPTPYTKSIALVIKNEGASLARDVVVEFEPQLPTAERSSDGQASVVPYITRRYAEPIGLLPPGRELSNVYLVSSASATNVDGVPEKLTVTIAYTDDEGLPYNDAYPLDVNVIYTGTVAAGSQSPQRQLEDAVRQLGVAAKALSRMSDELRDLRATLGGRDPDAERDDKQAQAWARHRALRAQVLPPSDTSSQPPGSAE